MSQELTDLFGSLGNIITIIFFFLPLFIIIDLCKDKDTSKITWLLFIFTILNCEFWMIYGIKINAWAIYVCNGVGILTNSIYITIFLIFLEEEELWRRILFILIIFGTFILTFFLFILYIDNIQLIGTIALIMNMFMYAAPLQKICYVYKYKDNSFINIWIGICLASNSLIWLLYGYFKSKDYFIIIPNAFGLILNLFQIYLWLKFKKATAGKNKKKLKFNEEANTGSDDELNKKQHNELNEIEEKLDENIRIENSEKFEQNLAVDNNEKFEKIKIIEP